MPFQGISNRSCIVITGGGSGIGLALGKQFLARGHEVIAVGRTLKTLELAKSVCPGLIIFQADVEFEIGRRALFGKIEKEYPHVNVLINNAGVVEKAGNSLLSYKDKSWTAQMQQISINLEAPMDLCKLFLPLLLEKPNALIANVSSNLAFVPFTGLPVYSASKAGLHSFTMSLREQLKGTSVNVVEIIPPLVETDMLPAGMKGINAETFAEGVIAQLLGGSEEIGYFSDMVVRGTCEEWDAVFHQMNDNLHFFPTAILTTPPKDIDESE